MTLINLTFFPVLSIYLFMMIKRANKSFKVRDECEWVEVNLSIYRTEDDYDAPTRG